jgi:acyl transferase domain-containing protein
VTNAALPPDHKARLKHAIVTIRRLQEQVAKLEQGRGEPIAIVGVGCRFPGGADGPEKFWELLEAGKDAITEVPSARWDRARYFDPDPAAPGKMYTLAGGFVADVERFDAGFFGMSPRVAAKLDPQQRMLLEVVWESLEHAGIPPTALAESSAGVFVGISTHDYVLHLSRAGVEEIDAYSMTGPNLSFAAGRLAYFLGSQGPTIAVDTACSSSLVALHLACESLHTGETDLAIVAGVNAILTPDHTIACCKASMLSKRGRCSTFDAAADGFVRSEGCGVVLLKRLRDADRAGDNVLAIISGSAINQDGATSGVTVPNKQAQVAVIRRALDRAGLEPADIDYVEAHGTGTQLGDPIEVRALEDVFSGPMRTEPLKIGSVKTNIGHLEAASGIAGVIKVALALQRQKLPAHLHLREPTPHIDWRRLPISIPTTLTPWNSGARPRRAGVSSFGASGTNAHVVVEEYRPANAVQTMAADAGAERAQLLCLAARTETALIALAERYERTLASGDAPDIVAICRTASCGRAAFDARVALVASTSATLQKALADFRAGQRTLRITTGTARGTPPRIAFLLAGRAGDHFPHARELYACCAAFKRHVDECAAALDGRLDRALPDVLFEPPWTPEHAETASFVFGYAVAQTWLEWGIEPTALLGRGVGEYLAACLAGVFTLGDALGIVIARARLLARCSADGAMIGVAASSADVAAAIAEHGLSLAAVNAPNSVVVAGERAAVVRFGVALAARSIEWRLLEVPLAYQSPLLDQSLDDIEQLVSAAPRARPMRRVVSSLTGRVVDRELTEPQYWRRHARETLEFDAAIRTVGALGTDVWLEVGTGQTLAALGRRVWQDVDARWLASQRSDAPPWESLLAAVGALYAAGASVDWERFYRDSPGCRVSLPTYPFERARHWIDLPRTDVGTARTPAAGAHPLLGVRVSSPLPSVQFIGTVGIKHLPWLEQHRIVGFASMPAAGFIEIVAAAASEVMGTGASIEDLFIEAPLALDAGQQKAMHVVVDRSGNEARCRISSCDESVATQAGAWRQHASARIVEARGGRAGGLAATTDIDALSAGLVEEVAVSDVYSSAALFGAELGPAFQTLARLRRGAGAALGWIDSPTTVATAGQPYILHPTLVDAWLQVAYEALPASERGDTSFAVVPSACARIRVFSPPAQAAVVHAKARSCASAGSEIDLHVLGLDGRQLVALEGLRFARLPRTTLVRSMRNGRRDGLYSLEWHSSDTPPPLRHTPRRWLVVTGHAAGAERLAAELRAGGENVTVAQPGDDFSFEPNGRCTLRVGRREDLVELASKLAEHRDAPWVVVYASALDAMFRGRATELPAYLCGELLGLVQALDGRAPGGIARLAVVTARAQGPDVDAAGVAQSPLWGLGRVIAMEQPALRTLLLDTDPIDSPERARAVAAAITDDAATQLVYRNGIRYTPRLAPVGEPRAARKAYRLELGASGLPDSFVLRPAMRVAPGPGEVEIEVAAAGLNFRDVLMTFDMYRGTGGAMGSECAGRIVSVGPGVNAFAPGDEVLAIVFGAFASHVVTPAKLTWRKPRNVDFVQAAALPIAFLTAAYCLEHLGGIRAGDRVLIHSASGGVGMAALQLAKRAGAEVFATAGTEQKRSIVKALGAAYVMDSRSLTFADEILRETEGRGVDFVLNSLTGNAIERGLAATRRGGCFLEIGRAGIWSAEDVAATGRELRYFPVMLGDACTEDPDTIQRLGSALFAAIESGEIQPLPAQSFPIERAADAVRLMAQARHTGKLVLAMHPSVAFEIRPDAAYLVTGGLGGIGLAVARWLTRLNAGRIVLLGRRAPDGTALAAIETLRRGGADVVVLNCDIGNRDEVARAMAAIDAGDKPLRGILHAAGVSDDRLLADQDSESFAKVFAAKVDGTWNLHELARARDLDFFVAFSSVSALFGAPGQANYAAANAFLDAYAAWRRQAGANAVSVNWGPWAEVGLYAHTGTAAERSASQFGMRALSEPMALELLEQGLCADFANIAAMHVDRERYVASTYRGRVPWLDGLLAAEPDVAAAASPAAPPEPLAAQLAAIPERQRRQVLIGLLREHVGAVLGCSSAELSATKAFRDLGMDSLMSVELRNRLQAVVSCALNATLAFDYPDLNALADYLLGEIERSAEIAPVRPKSSGSGVADVGELAAISDDDAEALLLAELASSPRSQPTR